METIYYDADWNCYLHNSSLIIDLEKFIAVLLKRGMKFEIVLKEKKC